MIRQTSLLAFGTLMLAAPAGAATYAAKPVGAVAAKRIIARDISWSCGPAACRGASAESRPLVLCQGLAKQAGPIASFIVDGRAFSVAELATCNRSAAAPAGPARAN